MQWCGLFTIVTLILHCLVVIHAQNILLEIQLQRYTNEICNNDCFSFMRFCLQSPNTDDPNLCPFGVVAFEINNDDLIFETGDKIDMTSTIVNPITFGIIMGNYQLCIEILNTMDDNNRIAKFNKDISVTTSTTGSNISVSDHHRRRIISLQYFYHVRCAPDYYGSNCSKWCTPVDDITGHFTCGDNGEIICLPGYINATSAETEGRCTLLCDPLSPSGCLENGTAATTIDTGFITVELSNEDSQLSSGGVAGLVISLLIIILLIALGTMAGILLWRYQPWDNAVEKNQVNGALNNPIYEVHDTLSAHVNGRTQSTQSLDSDPLYNSHEVASLQQSGAFVENQSLVNMLHSSATSLPGEDPPTNIQANNAPHNESLSCHDGHDVNGLPSGAKVTLDPYASYRDSLTAFTEPHIPLKIISMGTNSASPDNQDVEESNFDDAVEFDDSDYEVMA